MGDWNKELVTIASGGNVEDLKVCIENGADVNYKKDDGETALMIAGRWGCLGAIRVLLDNRCDIDAKDEHGITTLMIAAMNGKLDVIQLLVRNGCDKDARDDDGVTALMYAAQWGQLEATQFLLHQGCYKEAVNKYKYTALMMASSNGHPEITEALIQGGCNIEARDDKGWTLLMSAIRNGQLKVAQLLLDKGCSREAKNNDGVTALLLAAKHSQLEATRLLLRNGSDKDARDNDGKTALHFSAENGKLLITTCLVQDGNISPLVKTHQDETPYDLAASDNEGPHKEVMKYLQFVIKKQDQDVSPKSSEQIKAAPLVTDDIIPAEIKLMADKRSVPLYLKLLKSGSEKKRDIRLVIVGKKGAGKTSLVQRLCGKETTGVSSTNGIDIHTIVCKTNSNDCKWKIFDGNKKKTEIHARLLKPYKEKLMSSESVETPVEDDKAVKNNRPVISLNKSRESETSSTQLEKDNRSGTTDFQCKSPVSIMPHQHRPDQNLERVEREIEKMMQSKVDLDDKEEYAKLLLWDFAGDEEFYHTHQTFLSQDAIYLVVTKLNEAEDKEAQDLFRLWMNSIHCYSSLEKDKNNSTDSKTKSDDLDPPVVIVGTWRDVVTSVTGEIVGACREKISKYTESMTVDECRHVRDKYFISNTQDNNSVFLQIRKAILNLAKTMKTWNKEYPLKFIQMEKQLQEKKRELPIISYQEIKQISIDSPTPLNDEELGLFLEFHHEIRALVYFKDLPNFIILDTQWLSDAFKCIVTAEAFKEKSIRNQKEWKELYSRGRLHDVVLEEIFKEGSDLKKHKDHILRVMEKFDIVIRQINSEKCPVEDCFYVPCLIKEGHVGQLYAMFNATENICKSTWLCFEFTFRPPHIMNHLIASLSRAYTIADVDDPQHNNRQIALYRDTVVFELLKETKLRKLFVMTGRNLIQIQVLEIGKEIERGSYKYIADFVTKELDKIINTRFKMSNVSFEKKWECGLTKPEFVVGLNEFSVEQITKYHCTTCNDEHTFIGEWSGQPRGVYEQKPGQRGLVLIINYLFKSGNRRNGSDNDVEELKGFFSRLKYDIECPRKDLSKENLLNCFKTIEQNKLTEKSQEYHSFVCVIMSHGDEKGIQTTTGQITVDEIKSHFKNKPQGKFNGKPKVFLIQACRGQLKQEKVLVSDYVEVKTDTNEFRKEDKLTGNRQSSQSEVDYAGLSTCSSETEEIKLPTDADIIVAYATTPGYLSIRHPYEGANFIRAFMSVATKTHKNDDIEVILRNVRNELARDPQYEGIGGELHGKCQMAISESTSTMKFFL